MNSLVSIIMPTHNRGYIIQNAISSVRAQTYKDWELVIVDDGSNDNTENIVKMNEDMNIKYIKLEQNGGATRARNIGMINAEGDCFAFLDSDNVWKPSHLELSMKAISEGADLTFGRVKVIVDKNRQIVYPETKADELLSTEDVLKYELLSNAFDTNVVCMKRICWKKCGGFSEKQEKLQDWEYFFRIVATKKFSVKFIDEIIADSYYQEDSLSHNDTLMFDARFNIFRYHIEEYRKYGLVGSFLKDILPYNRTFKNYDTDSLYEKFLGILNNKEMNELKKEWTRIRKNDEIASNDYLFPFHLFHRNDRVMVCGSKEIVECFSRQTLECEYIKTVGFVIYDDTLPKNVMKDKLSLEISKCPFEYMLVAVDEKQVAQKLKDLIEESGVKRERIVWDGLVYKNKGFFNNLYFGLLDKLDIKVKKCSVDSSARKNEYIGGKISNMQYNYLNNFLYRSLELERQSRIIDIIIPVYNAIDLLKKCIDSIYRNTTSPYRLFLINDKSTDPNIEKYLSKLENRKKTKYLQEQCVLHNEKNLGFVQTVNKGLKITTNDVVILNTDTEVPLGWLERMASAAAKDDKIASITPFSNSATICSFPDVLKDNDIYKGKSVDELDKFFKECNFDEPIEIPTAVGFCMYMSRESIEKVGLLDEIFEEGYGEENDWCMRAIKQGYKNVFMTNLFVYHKHGASVVSQRYLYK